MEKAIKKSAKQAIILTHPNKVLYAEDHITKQNLYDYYDAVSAYILPFIQNRPLTLVRCPKNYQKCFYQKHLNQAKAQALHTVPIKGKNDITAQYIYLNDQMGLLSLVQMGVLEIHPWGSTIQHLDSPDLIIFDLDPAPDVPWREVVKAALDIKEALTQLKLTSFVKTTGGKGLHIVIPIKPEYDWGTVKNFAHAFVEFLEKRHPERYVSTMAKGKRKGKIFIDYLRNQREATAVAPYSSRARLHAPVATPLHWDELSYNAKDTFYTIKSIPKRLQGLKEDPWQAFWTIKQVLNLDKFS